MPRIIEVPTHLNVEDTLLLNLTARQLARLAACASLAYALLPRRLAWRRPMPDPAAWRLSGPEDWAELDPRVGWRTTGAQLQDEEDEEPAARWHRWRRR